MTSDILCLPANRCGTWLIGSCCLPCVTFVHRTDVLGEHWREKYVCCQNITEDYGCPVSADFSKASPDLCLCIESCLLPGLSNAGSRHQMKKDINLIDRPVEKYCGLFILASYFIIGPLSCTFSNFLTSCLWIQQDDELRYQGRSSSFWDPSYSLLSDS